MFNLVSLIIGFVALILAVITFIPLLGLGEWLALLLALLGAGIGMISRSTAGRNLNIFVVVVAIIRLVLGHVFLGAAPRTPKAAPKPAPELHPEFAAALAKAPKAKAALNAFPPSAQRDYFEWIAEAKQDATRQKRIASAVDWLSEGKRRHWKYEAKKP